MSFYVVMSNRGGEGTIYQDVPNRPVAKLLNLQPIHGEYRLLFGPGGLEEPLVNADGTLTATVMLTAHSVGLYPEGTFAALAAAPAGAPEPETGQESDDA